MKTHIVYTLLDGSRHDTLKEAKEHCVEQLGAELKDFAFDRGNYEFVYKMLTDIVIHKKHDRAIFAYVEWRKELDELESYEKTED